MFFEKMGLVSKFRQTLSFLVYILKLGWLQEIKLRSFVSHVKILVAISFSRLIAWTHFKSMFYFYNP